MSAPKRRCVTFDSSQEDFAMFRESQVYHMLIDRGWDIKVNREIAVVASEHGSSSSEEEADTGGETSLTMRKMLADQAYNNACAALYRPYRFMPALTVPVIRTGDSFDHTREDDDDFLALWNSKTSLACAFFTNRILVEWLRSGEKEDKLDTEAILEMDKESKLLRGALTYVMKDPDPVVEAVPVGAGLDRHFLIKEELAYCTSILDALYVVSEDGLVVRPLVG
jgi:hypothetical protein